MATLGPVRPDVPPELVRAQLARILASEGFANSERVSRFLRFVVEEWLRGKGEAIKEYLVGREVFDRKDDYDPRLDPIVRVEARRLRSKLEEYYAGPGKSDGVLIRFRKGSYAPVVETVEEGSRREARPGAKLPRWAALAGLAVLAAALGLSHFARNPEGPRIVIAPASWLGPDSKAPDAYEEGLTEAVTAELAQRPGFQVISWPSIMSYRNSRKRANEIATEMHAERVLVVSARRLDAEVRVFAHLVNPGSDRKTWAAQYTRSAQDAVETQREVARLLAAELEAYQRGASPR